MVHSVKLESRWITLCSSKNLKKRYTHNASRSRKHKKRINMTSESTKKFALKFKTIESRINEIFGEFCLFALFLPDERPSKWDLVVSAPWLNRSDIDKMRGISEILNEELGDEIVKLSRVVVLEPKSDFVQELNKRIRIEKSIKEYINEDFLDISMKYAFIFTSKKEKNQQSSSNNTSKRLKSIA